MAHPFSKLLEAALKKCTADHNAVTVLAFSMIEKGYSPVEVYNVIVGMAKGRLDDDEVQLLQEAIEAITEEYDIPANDDE